jgi:hypothetical protein
LIWSRTYARLNNRASDRWPNAAIEPRSAWVSHIQ